MPMYDLMFIVILIRKHQQIYGDLKIIIIMILIIVFCSNSNNK